MLMNAAVGSAKNITPNREEQHQARLPRMGDLGIGVNEPRPLALSAAQSI